MVACGIWVACVDIVGGTVVARDDVGISGTMLVAREDMFSPGVEVSVRSIAWE
jgi:hypothetical protein